ncbi:hypothetical protein [Mesorhizobium onobrychidis]|uniref:Uncharacterized protein n=1 Tax=Mesorhizobium onobrychidis TaxID=2775404 RepID=A0ABY5QTG1_9HYPH|nr:hypothetical protein [Mesorhizobium onobrychidis]UVC13514.1 hypothetical protein IHQ72_22710 [Mesorhizobium onobrychidis]
MAEVHSACSISAFDGDVLRSAFKKSVIEERIPEDRWPAIASHLVRDLTGYEHVAPELLAWIMRK